MHKFDIFFIEVCNQIRVLNIYIYIYKFIVCIYDLSIFLVQSRKSVLMKICIKLERKSWIKNHMSSEKNFLYSK
jgi:hypothetical protein